jgi:alkylation response protein AidB-like acyl-CoA dehydrogenase
MQPKPSLKTIQKQCFNAGVFPSEVLDWIASENLWNLWVPKNYGGLEFSLTEGLRKLQFLAKIDGSLGWTITLCSGANYFIGNLDREAREAIFRSSQQPIVLGGSGGAFVTAEK